MASKAARSTKKTKKAKGPGTVAGPKPARVDLSMNGGTHENLVKTLTARFAEAIKKAPARGMLFPSGTMTPNMAGDMLGITGEAVKQWIYKGRLKAAKLGNGYFAIKPEHLAEVIFAQGATAVYKPQPNKKYLKRNKKSKSRK